MALQRPAIALAFLLAWTHWSAVSGIMICPSPDYRLGPNGDSCYLYHHTLTVYSAANRTCVRAGSTMIIIQTQEENEWVYQNLFEGPGNEEEFWLGMHDQDTEGTFRWIDGSVPLYEDRAPTFTDDNTNSLDCVKFTSSGWTIHSEGCGIGRLPFVCESKLCESDDGQICNNQIVTSSGSSGGGNILLIAVVVVIVIVVIVVIVVVVLLVFMWKFHNDAFHRYCCCCVKRGSKTAVHSLQQENQRLRQELSQHKLSLTGSGRYSQGQFARELSGVPDGRGGVLPTIKQAGGPPISPTIYEDRPLTLGSQPPPLVPQRGFSRVAPTFSRFPSQTQAPLSPPGLFTPGPRPPAPTLGGMATVPDTGPSRLPIIKPPVKRNIFEEMDVETLPGEKQAPVAAEEVKPTSKSEEMKAVSKEDEESGSSSDASSEHNT